MTYVYEVLTTSSAGHKVAFVVVLADEFDSMQPYELEAGRLATAAAANVITDPEVTWSARAILREPGEILDTASARLVVASEPQR